MIPTANAPTAHERADEKPHKQKAKITINAKLYEVHPSPASVEHLKHLAGIGAGDMLEQEVHGHLHRLADDGAVEIHGGEAFVSKPKVVGIKINTKEYHTHPGKNSVEHIRHLGQVPADEVLSEFKNGAFVDLPNNGHVQIHGAEIFASHRPTGGSS
ncbi:MAG TPA: hypothetical protein VH595_13340 [Verrucomicrobiae bacterium]|jgi:hypothetical protein|nr:hypothetical protein [Verrucomicrobiae bacterium]